jgi:hypothetical protein
MEDGESREMNWDYGFYKREIGWQYFAKNTNENIRIAYGEVHFSQTYKGENFKHYCIRWLTKMF